MRGPRRAAKREFSFLGPKSLVPTGVAKSRRLTQARYSFWRGVHRNSSWLAIHSRCALRVAARRRAVALQPRRTPHHPYRSGLMWMLIIFLLYIYCISRGWRVSCDSTGVDARPEGNRGNAGGSIVANVAMFESMTGLPSETGLPYMASPGGACLAGRSTPSISPK